MKTSPVLIDTLSGCFRDGTLFDAQFLVDNQWNRIQNSRCKSMGGYRRIFNQLTGIGRGMNVFDSGGYSYVAIGTSDALEQVILDQFANVNGLSTRTPAGFVSDSNNLWTFDYIYDSGSLAVTIVAHAAPNLMDITSTTPQDVWYGSATGVGALTTTGSSVSGGVVCIQPYTITYGTAGVLNWSVPNDPTDYSGTGSGTARVSALKIVAGMPIRGGAGNSPSGLFWTLDSIVRMTFVGGTTIFQFDTFSNQASILSQQSVVEYDGVYYWVGIDRFMSFNGVVREVPNDMNLNWFFDNLNMQYRQKVFAFKIPRWGEIWWCYPRGSATECTHAVILNLREKRPDGMPVWYDVELPQSGRSCGRYSQVFSWPLMCGVDADDSSGTDLYKLWQHEYGNDVLDGTDVLAIEKYFTTQEYNYLAPVNGQGEDVSLIGDVFEPDFLQTGDMTVQMIGRANARAPNVPGDIQTFIAQTEGVGTTSLNQAVYFPAQTKNQRLMRFKISSNTQGGSYFAGRNILHAGKGDGRYKS